MKVRGSHPFLTVLAPTCMVLFCAAVVASAATRIVPTDFPTIQSAIAASATGDTVLVRPGSYAERLDLGGKGLRLISTDGPQVSTLEYGNFRGHGVDMGAGDQLMGFTIHSAISDHGGAVFVFAGGVAPVIRSNVFSVNDAFGSGAAIFIIDGANPLIERNLFRYQCLFCGTQRSVISGSNNGSPKILNNVFVGNNGPCLEYLGSAAGFTGTVINNTFVGNRGAAISFPIGTPGGVFRNNLIVSNDVGLSAAVLPAVWQNNLVFGNGTDYLSATNPTGTAGNISVAPNFHNRASDDLHLRQGSPGIDAGNTTNAPIVDFDGLSRPLDGNRDGVARIDIGAYEFVPLFFTSIAKAGNNTRLSWFGTPAGMRLQAALSLSNPMWTNVPFAPGTNSIELPTIGNSFFRLLIP